MTAGQRLRRRRNLVMFALAGGPFTNRFLADVFDLVPSRIHAVLSQLARESGLSVESATSEARSAWALKALEEVIKGRGQSRRVTS